jgi:hypothetical protein
MKRQCVHLFIICRVLHEIYYQKFVHKDFLYDDSVDIKMCVNIYFRDIVLANTKLNLHCVHIHWILLTSAQTQTFGPIYCI